MFQFEKFITHIPRTKNIRFSYFNDLLSQLETLRPYEQLRVLNIPGQLYESNEFYKGLAVKSGEAEIVFGSMKGQNIWYFRKSRTLEKERRVKF